MNVDGKNVCDGCGSDIGNGSVREALIVSDIVDNVVQTYRLCRDREVDSSQVDGCARLAKNPTSLAAYLEQNPEADGWPTPLT